MNLKLRLVICLGLLAAMMAVASCGSSSSSSAGTTSMPTQVSTDIS